MKNCDYCGRETVDDATYCKECGRPFSISEVIAVPQSIPQLPTPKHIKPDALAQAFSFESGFHRADWDFINGWIDVHVASDNYEQAWNEALLLWAGKLRNDLGGDYYIIQSDQTVFLCSLDLRTANWLLGYAGAVASTIRDYLGTTAWNGAVGKDFFIIFSDQDDYYQYLSFHSPDGEQATSAGVCVHSGYTHIALPWQNENEAANTIVHELTHDCLAHLEIPIWLNEGVALTMQNAIAPRQRSALENPMDGLWASATNWRPPIMWEELAERHFAFWNEQNIQSFWAGTSFHEPGDPNELSYSLAQVLIKHLSDQDRGNSELLREFIEQADRADAGQHAAATIFKTDLGEIAATFLGNGRWRPDRRSIEQAWQSAGWVNT